MTLGLTGTPNGLVLNFWFALAYLVCAYNFYRAITLDPGHSRLPQNEAELNSVGCSARWRTADIAHYTAGSIVGGGSRFDGEIEWDRILY